MQVGGNSYAFGPLAGYPYYSATSTGASEEANIGSSFYNALQTSLVRRFSHGLTVNVNYVWSHMTDNVDGSRACVLSIFATPEPCFYDQANGNGPVGPILAGATTPSPFFNNNAAAGSVPTTPGSCAAAGASVCRPVFGWQVGDNGNGAQDVRNRFSWGLNYQIPFGKSMTGVEGALLKDWAVNTGGSWQTGLPFSTTPSTNLSGISGAGYLDQTCNPHKSGGTLLDWFNFNCYVQPTQGTLGRQEPNQIFGPSQKSVSISLSKEFAIKENIKMQFRTEIFNAFNQVNFNVPTGNSVALSFTQNCANGVPGVCGPVNNGGPGSTHTPGEITAVNANFAPRQIQFALKLIF
jgi:hypothetical protein